MQKPKRFKYVFTFCQPAHAEKSLNVDVKVVDYIEDLAQATRERSLFIQKGILCGPIRKVPFPTNYDIK